MKKNLLRFFAVFLAAVILLAALPCALADEFTEKSARSDLTASLASIARSQIGSDQFRVWYKDELPAAGDWSAVMVSSCLSGAEVWKSELYGTDSQDIYNKLDDAGVVKPADSYEPLPGDVAFFYENGVMQSGIVVGAYSDGSLSVVSADKDGHSQGVIFGDSHKLSAFAVLPDHWFGAEGENDIAPDDSDELPHPLDSEPVDVSPAPGQKQPAPSSKPSSSSEPSPSAEPGDTEPIVFPDDPGADAPLKEIKPAYIAAGVGGVVVIAAAAIIIHKKKKVKKAFSELYNDIGR